MLRPCVCVCLCVCVCVCVCVSEREREKREGHSIALFLTNTRNRTTGQSTHINCQDLKVIRTFCFHLNNWTFDKFYHWEASIKIEKMVSRTVIPLCLLVLCFSLSSVTAWGGLFNRFNPSMLSNMGYGGHGGNYGRELFGVADKNVGEVNIILEFTQSSKYYYFALANSLGCLSKKQKIVLSFSFWMHL